MEDLFEEDLPEQDLSLFEPEPGDTKVANTSSSEKNLLAQASILSGGDLVETYRTISAMTPEEKKATLSNISREAKEQETNSNFDVVASLVQDPSMSEEAKEELVQAFSGESVKPYSSLKGVAEKLYMSSTGRETESEERRLATVGELIDPIMEEVVLRQEAISALSYDEEGDAVSLGNNFGDLAELLIMMNEQAYAVQIRSAIDSGEVSNVEQLATFALLGEGKEWGKEDFNRLSPEERKDFIKKSFNIFNSAKTMNLLNDNDLIQLDNAMTLFQDDYYTTTDRVLDNIGSLLDSVPVVNLLAKSLKGIYKSAKVADLLRKAGIRRVASQKQPASIVSLAEQVNPESARSMAKTVADDESGEAAEVLTGTTRTEASVEMHGPQVKSPDGSVEAKPYAMDRDILAAAYQESSRMERTPTELANAREKTSENLGKIGGLARPDELSMSHTLKDNGSIDVSEVYVAREGAFTSPDEAIGVALQQLEHYGVTTNDITIMRKSGTEWVETTAKEAGAKNLIRESLVAKKQKLPEEFKKVNMQDEYALKVDFNYSPRAMDIARDDLSVKLNFLDSLSTKAPVPGRGTASRYLFQVSHMLDPRVASASVLAVDRGNRLQKVLMDKFNKGISEPMESLPEANAMRLSKVMHDQNMARKNFTREQLEQMGVVDEAEFKILDNWKYMNDQLWHLSNTDMAKTLREQDYSMYVDTASDSKFIGKVLSQNTPLANRPSIVYDSASGQTKLTSNSWAQWDLEGAKVIALKTPQVIDDVEVAHILVRKGESGKYVKAIQDNDTILPYIEGWSHIDYKSPYFIERVMKDKNGVEMPSTRQAILTSPESKSAQMAVDRLTENASNALKDRTWSYSLRNARDMDRTETALKKFEVASTAGLTSQRKRGNTLQEFDSSRMNDMTPNIADPVESFKNSAAELARRVPMREYLDDLEARIVKKYGEVLPTDDFGKPRLPNSGESFTKGAKVGSKENKMMADAKAMVEHYNYLKFGYYNGIDAGWKNVINMTSKIAGTVSRRLEKSVLAVGEEIPSLVGAFKGTAFNAHIALSAPPSQWMVQGLPALMNALLHPQYVAGGGMLSDMRKLVVGITKEGDDATLIKQLGKEKAAEIIQLRKEWDKTGLAVGVDKHLLVENGLEGMMPTNRFQKIKKPVNWLTDKGREKGFDKGETGQLMAFWLAARHDAIKSGKSMDNAADFDAVRAKTRTLTMNMNKAGEMPWNKDSLSMWTQFMISPYKALTMVLDRGLTAQEKATTAAWQFLVMPLPATFTYHVRAAVGVEGTEGDLITETITNGLFGGIINTLANEAFEDIGSASWQRNVQFDPEFAGVFTLAQIMVEDMSGVNMMQAIAQASPSLSMFSGYNPYVTNLFKSFGSAITAPLADTPDEAWNDIKSFAGPNGALWQYSALGRGLSTAYKELLTDQLGKRYSSISGKLQDEDVSFMETFARAAFGLETTWQTVARKANKELYEGSKDMMADADLILAEMERMATVEGFNMDDPRRTEYVLRHVFSAFEGGRPPPKMAQYFMKKLRPDMTLSQKLLSGAGWGVKEIETFYKAMGNASPEIQQMSEWNESNKRAGGEE